LRQQKPFALSALVVTALSIIPLQFPFDAGAQSELNQSLPPVSAAPVANSGPKPLSAMETEIYALLEAGQTAEADAKIEEAYKQARHSKNLDSSILFLAAFSQFNDENYGHAATILKEIQELPGEKNLSLKDQVILQRLIAECYYRDRNTSEALKHFNLALICAGSNDIGTSLRGELEEGLVGCNLAEKRYQEAEAPALRFAQLMQANSNQLSGLCPFFWANVYLAETYKGLGNKQKHKLYSATAAGLLKTLMTQRNEIEATAGNVPLRIVRSDFLKDYMDETQPQSLGEYLWLATTFKLKTLPIIGWRDPDLSVKSKAIIVAVHGMGLDNRAFTPFAREMKRRGYSVFAIDVRGFGSWMAVSGNENIEYKDSFGDINNLVQLVKAGDPTAPVFLLGESMGGAIALNTASRYPDQLSGVIASVPSAEILQARRMSLTVAMHFLKGPNKPFNVGKQIAAQATARPEMRQAWQTSLKAKNELSPKDMMKFAVFMRRTESHCREITKTPVLMVQGLKDKLVKAQGTYDLFEAVKSDDKTMIIVGNAEHLIFETDNQNVMVLDSLCSWIDEHSAPGQPAINAKK